MRNGFVVDGFVMMGLNWYVNLFYHWYVHWHVDLFHVMMVHRVMIGWYDDFDVFATKVWN